MSIETKRKNSGFTLIEILVTVTIMALLVGVLVSLLQNGLEAWTVALGEVSLQKTLSMVIGEITVGDFDTRGIGEALEIREATPTSISYVPLQEDFFPEGVANGMQEFTLQHHFKPGTSYPVVEIRSDPGNDWSLVPREYFEYGSLVPPSAPDDKVRITTPIPAGNETRILYHAFGQGDDSVVVNVNWDGASLRNYSTPLEIKTMQDVDITDFQLAYFDKAGNQIANPGSNLDDIFSVRVNLSGKSNDIERTVSSFTRLLVKERLNIHTIRPGHAFSISIPDSADVTALGVKNIIIPGAPPGTGSGQIQLRLISGTGDKWFISINITNSKISSYQIDYPEQGPIVYDYEENVDIPLEQGVEFLDFGDSTYNYNNLGFTNATFESVIMTGIAGIAVYTKP